MNYYIPLALYILLVSILFQESKKKILLLLLTFVPLLLFFGTRVDFGVDYENYLNKFEMQHDWDLAQYILYAGGGKFEPGFFLLIKTLPSFNALIFVCTALVLLPVALFFYEFIPKGYYPLAFVLYLFSPRIFESFVAMRSGIVLGLFLLAVVLKYRGYLKTAFVIVLISGSFHMSGFFLAPIILMSSTFLKKYYNLVSITVIVLMFLALLVPTFYGDVVVKLTESVEELSDYKGHVGDTGYGLGFYLFSFVRLLFVFYIFSLIKKGVIDDQHLWIAWMTILLYFMNMIQGFEMMYRIAFYFYMISIPFKCYVLIVDKSQAAKLYVGLSVLFLLYQFVELMQLEQIQSFMWNYKSFLF